MVVFIAFLFVIPSGFIDVNLGGIVLTISTFLFGILAGFYIFVTTTDYNNVKSLAGSETAGWIWLYNNAAMYDARITEKLVLLIDNYICRAFDYEFIDYARSTVPEFENIQKFLREIPAKPGSEILYDKIRDAVNNITLARQQLAVLGAKALSIFEWLILIVLAGIVTATMYGMRTGSLFFDAVTVALAASLVLVLLLIREIDLYMWNEKTFAVDVFENVFIAIGQLPYYPSYLIDVGRVMPEEKEYRVGVYKDYPRSLERTMEIRRNAKP